MKYFDKNTMISQNKHLDKDVRNPWDPIGDREQRRLDKKNYKKFLTKSIYKEYEHILRMCKYNRNVPDFKKWISMVKEDYKPNVQLYRERMIDNVLK